jgi:RecQ family ATP-dependent DNA helicase
MSSLPTYRKSNDIVITGNNNGNINPNDDDGGEYGDDSFLADFDVDAAVAAATTNYATTSFSVGDSDLPPASKRTKVLPASAPAGPASAGDLEKCLMTHFGFSAFRDGQMEAIQAVLQGRDVTFYAATGSGKSLCYQLPALYSKKVAIVVSPLISLMQDQAHKLNGLSDQGPMATYLGSAQTDGLAERRALNGEFRIVYLTPEKLMVSGFLDGLAGLDLVLVAFDEAHCVSQWGHDFRKDYREAGSALRNHPRLGHIPIMALTASAIPRVQNDIIQSLRLRSPFVCAQSFDRTNLSIKVMVKDKTNPLAAAMEPLIRSLIEKPDSSSTIVYAITRSMTEEIASYLQQRLHAQGSSVDVQAYHAGLTGDKRHQVHIQFLTGKTAVVVATVAFGMGIDKVRIVLLDSIGDQCFVH